MSVKMAYRFFLIGLLALIYTPLYASFFEEKREGWHWYQDPIVEDFQEKKEAPQKIISEAGELMAPLEMVKAYQKELEKKLHKAWVSPTAKNIQSYQEMQKDLMQRSQHFSEIWMQVVYNNPHLDHTLVSPVNQKSRHLYLDHEKQQTVESIRDLKEEYGLFFFYSSQCEYCHQFAPIVQQFSKNYGWEVIAISADGGTIPGFSENVMNNGILENWRVEVLPALFAINPKTGHVLPIAYGLTALDQMETRIMTLLKEKP
jgi:conjugal transfer pilus assembly protein TraF